MMRGGGDMTSTGSDLIALCLPSEFSVTVSQLASCQIYASKGILHLFVCRKSIVYCDVDIVTRRTINSHKCLDQNKGKEILYIGKVIIRVPKSNK